MRRALGSAADFLTALAGVVAISFILMQWLPGDPAEIYAGEEASFEEVEAVRRRMGLDRPLPIQFAQYLSRAARGDLGTSIRSGRPVILELRSRMGATFLLASLALAFAAAVALPIGIMSAAHPRSTVVQAMDWVGLAILSVPVYWLGLTLILLFSLTFRVFPAGGDATIAHYLLPAAALGAHTGVATARVLRSSLADILAKPYLNTARSKGATQARTLWKHALPNALAPALTYFALESGRLLGGAVLTETIFSINGLGRFVVQSIAFRDYPSVLGAVLLMAAAVMAANLAADLVCSRIDPRLRGL